MKSINDIAKLIVADFVENGYLKKTHLDYLLKCDSYVCNIELEPKVWLYYEFKIELDFFNEYSVKALISTIEGCSIMHNDNMEELCMFTDFELEKILTKYFELAY